MNSERWRKIERNIEIKASHMIVQTNTDIRDDFAQIGRIKAWEVMMNHPEASDKYIKRSAFNAMKDESRRERIRHHVSVDAKPVGDSQNLWWKGATSVTWLDILSEEYESLRCETPDAPIMLDTLPLTESEREVIYAEWAHERQAEAATALGLTTCAFKGRLHRAQKRARQLAGVCQ